MPRGRWALPLLLALVAGLLCGAYGAALAYRWASGHVQVGGPAVWFEDPRYPGVSVELYRYNTSARAVAAATPRLERARRSAKYFDTFDSNPFAGNRVIAQSCTWVWETYGGDYAVAVSGGLRPSPWGYECVALVNLDISDYVAQGRRVYVAFLAWRPGYFPRAPTTIYMTSDAVYADPTTRRFYRVGYNNTLLGGRTGDSTYSDVRYFDGSAWRLIGRVSLGTTRTLEHHYLSNVGALVDFSAWVAEHWNATGLLQRVVVPTGYRFTPTRVGLGYWVSTTPFDPEGGYRYIYFDNLVVTVDYAPWFVNVTGLPDGWRAVLRNATGHKVSEAPASGGVAALPVWAPQADLTREPRNRNGLVFPNGVIEVVDAGGRLVVSQRFDYVVGGDVYVFYYHFAGPLLSVYTNMSVRFSGALREARLLAPCAGANVSIGMVSWSSARTAQNVTVVRGSLVRAFTEALAVDPPPQWGRKWLALNVTASARLPALGSCSIGLTYVWWVSEGAWAVYSVTVSFVSASGGSAAGLPPTQSQPLQSPLAVVDRGAADAVVEATTAGRFEEAGSL